MLVVAVVAVAYGAAAPELATAEFAPAARQAIEPPPTTAGEAKQAGAAGRRPTTTTVAGSGTATTTTPADGGSTVPTTRVGRARPCFGNPPRQAEDPMSPPCAATIFEGDNGGATSAGVTGTDIRIAVPMTSSFEAAYQPIIQALFDYLNQRFEFYGRRLVPVMTVGSTPNPAASRAFAADLATQSIFGAVTGLIEWGFGSAAPQEPFYQELARRGVLTVATGSGQWLEDRFLYDALHPYLWSVYPSAEDLQRNLADFYCSALAGKVARHAPDETLRSKRRQLGVVAFGEWQVPSVKALLAGLEACGESAAVVEVTSQSLQSPGWRTPLLSLQGQGATTVVCVCESFKAFHAFQNAATNGFNPEWLFSSSVSPDEEGSWQNYANPQQRPSAIFGVAERTRLVPMQANPWFQVLQQFAPGAVTVDVYRALYAGNALYATLLVMASGIQAAGPHLTPDSFAQGLMATQFPNVGAGQAPYWQPSAGFGPGDHSFFDDYALGWWSKTAEPLGSQSQPGRGSFCYLDAGARFAAGRYPADADARFFSPTEPCR